MRIRVSSHCQSRFFPSLITSLKINSQFKEFDYSQARRKIHNFFLIVYLRSNVNSNYVLLLSLNNQFVLFLLLVGSIFGDGNYGTIEIYTDGVTTLKKSRYLITLNRTTLFGTGLQIHSITKYKIGQTQKFFCKYLIYFPIN